MSVQFWVTSLQVLLAVFLIQESHGNLTISFDNIPFTGSLRYENKYSSVILNLKCSASYPVEFVFNDDTIKENNKVGRFQHEHSYRTFEQNIDEPRYTFTAQRYFRYPKLVEEESLNCRAVFDHGNNILLKMTPAEEGDGDGTSSIIISQHPNQKPASEDKQITEASTKCGAKFYVAQLETGNFWRCESANGTERQIEFHGCPWSAAYCANLFRNVKERGACIIHVNASASIDTTVWHRLTDDPPIPGVALCKPSGDGAEGSEWDGERIAVEYFFSGGFSSNVSHELRLKLLQFDANFRAVSERGYEEIEHDRTWKKKIELKLSNYGAGDYEIQCVGAVWNTTEWANKTHSITVREPIAPHFELTFENVTYQDGDSNKVLVCNAKGDPAPMIKWDPVPIAGARTEGSTFIISKVSKLFTDQAFIKCGGTNKFGQMATKSFLVHVNENEEDDSTTALSLSLPISTTTIVVIVIVAFVLVLLVLGGGLSFLYFKFFKLGSAIAAHLTSQEVKEFREGKSNANACEDAEFQPDGGCEAEAEAPSAIECHPYNSDFEVAKDNLIVDFNHVLGSGEYGIVYHGSIRLNSRGASPVQVAIKTVRKNVHINYFKALMSELKILAFIGHHENVVNLIGACTANIKNRELYVGVELCKTSLLKFLQDNRHGFQNFVLKREVVDELVAETSLSDYQNKALSDEQRTMSTYDLIKWSTDVASGMEFLRQRKVVHADLAARNILLSYKLNCKICDFGLARQLIDYTYIKSQQCPLPWKWMAIESLRDKKFSTKSDVWAFGVTLWEIYSLGQVPYRGMTWNMDFVDRLLSGLRMNKPAFASKKIFKMMGECWRENPKDRPTFIELKEFFQEMEVK